MKTVLYNISHTTIEWSGLDKMELTRTEEKYKAA